MKVFWRPAALDDQRAAVEWVEQHNPAAALRLLLAIRAAARSLRTLSHRGRPGLVPGTRELIVAHTYIMVYRVGDEEVTILRLWHAKQNRE